MVTSQFASILKDLETFFKCKLEPDSNNSCVIHIKEKDIKVHIEPNRYGDVLIAVRFVEIPSSKYRENVFKEALKSNQNTPHTGVFGFSKKASSLFIFLLLDQRNITPQKIESLLPPFLNKAQHWSDILKTGGLPLHEEKQEEEISPKSSIFEIHKH